MKLAFWIWTALCSSVVVFVFFAAPAWDTEADGFLEFSGFEVFMVYAVISVLVWVGGVIVLYLVRRARQSSRR